MKINTYSAKETQAIAQLIGQHAFNGMVLLLSGDLGAGKTTFTQGLALGLGIQKTVSSPTFTIMKNYQGRFRMNHLDAYRLEGLHQDLGFEELINSDAITVIEWPNYIKELWPTDYLMITFKRMDENSREIELIAQGSLYLDLLEKLV